MPHYLWHSLKPFLMVLNNLRLIDGNGPVNIKVSGSCIADVSDKPLQDATQLEFDGALVFPGLVNSHDHLDFNLFPAFGDKVYKNYTEWGNYIHQQYKDEIAAILKVPQILREEWGVLKNLLCGVTTVVNHGEKLQGNHTLINVHERYQFVHSIGFDKRWKAKLNNPLKRKQPVVVHIGEGNDMAAYREINELTKWNIFRKKLFGVHAVAMSEEQALKFKAVVWCPMSNYFLLNRTAPVNRLKFKTNILFGTDSTLTGDWNIWNHIRLARDVKMLSDVELIATLSTNAANAWQTGSKTIEKCAAADLVVMKTKPNLNSTENFFSGNPQDILLVIQGGNIRLFDEELYPQFAKIDMTGFSKIYVNRTGKYVQADVRVLMEKIKQYNTGIVFPISC